MRDNSVQRRMERGLAPHIRVLLGALCSMATLSHAVCIAHDLYPKAYLSSASAALLAPIPDGRLFISGRSAPARAGGGARRRALQMVAARWAIGIMIAGDKASQFTDPDSHGRRAARQRPASVYPVSRSARQALKMLLPADVHQCSRCQCRTACDAR